MQPLAMLITPSTGATIPLASNLNQFSNIDIQNSIASPSNSNIFYLLGQNTNSGQLSVMKFELLTSSITCPTGAYNYYEVCLFAQTASDCHPLCKTCFIAGDPQACAEANTVSKNAVLSLYTAHCPSGQLYRQSIQACSTIQISSCSSSCSNQCWVQNSASGCIFSDCTASQVYNSRSMSCIRNLIISLN